jgi:carbon storage regulator CsrA
MLVLGRKCAQTVRIDRNITIYVKKVGPKRVTIGVYAPYLPVWREEAPKSGNYDETGMLVLSRKVNQRFIIAGIVTVTVASITRKRNGWRTRLGFEAPEDVTILRGELEAA